MNKLIDADETKKNLCLFCNYSESCELDNYKDKCITMQAIDKTNDQRIKLTEAEKVKYFDGGYNKAHEELEVNYQELLYQAETNIRNKAIDDFYKNFINRIDWLREQNYDMYCAIGDDAHCILDDLKSRICS